MPKKSLEILTESMFYVLMTFCHAPKSGIDVVEYIDKKTNGALNIGPETLYTLLVKFESANYIC